MQIENAVASDLRAKIARQQVTLYKLAAEIDVHPGRLGMMLRGRIPLPSDVHKRIETALANERHNG